MPTSIYSLSLHDALPISYLARLQYAFEDKYLLTAAIRRDGSSRFGRNSKYGYFPSLTAGWILSKEHLDRKSTRLNSSHLGISYAVFCLKKKKFNPMKSWT